jgi:hypothetical protein
MDMHCDTTVNVTNTVTNDKEIELEYARENEPEKKKIENTTQDTPKHE